MGSEATGQGALADDLLDVDVHLVGLVNEQHTAVILRQQLAFLRAHEERQGEHHLGVTLVVLGDAEADGVTGLEVGTGHNRDAQTLAGNLREARHQIQDR